MDNGVSEEYFTALQDEANMYQRKVVEGKCKTFDVYRYDTGYIQGLQAAERILHETIQKLLNIQDLEDED